MSKDVIKLPGKISSELLDGKIKFKLLVKLNDADNPIVVDNGIYISTHVDDNKISSILSRTGAIDDIHWSSFANDKALATAGAIDARLLKKADKDDIPTKTSQLTNDSGFLTSHQLLKTINNESLIGSGNITIQGGGNGETNVIETVKVNGTALTPDANKTVDITAIPASIVTEDSTHAFATNAEKTKWNTLSNVIKVPTGPSLTVTSPTIMAVGESSPGYGIEENAIYIKAPTNSDDVNILKITGNGIQTAVLNNGNLSAWTNYDTGNLTPKSPLYVEEGTGSNTGITYIKLVGGEGTEITHIVESTDTSGGWEYAGNSGIPTIGLVSNKINSKYTKPSTGIPSSDLASAVQTSLGLADTALQPSYLIKTTDTEYQDGWDHAANNAIPTIAVIQDKLATALEITSSDISNWNSKTSNTGTITGITMNGASKGTSGVVDLGTVLTSFTETDPTVPAWAKASIKPTYTAAEVGALPDTTIIPTVNNATLTIQKNGTTVNTFTANASSNVTANILVNELPTVSSSDNGKVLMVVNGVWATVTPTAIYSGTSVPNNSTGNNGDLYLLTS